MAQRSFKADPNKTKTGKVRLGPLTIAQLETMLEKTAKPKEKSKILNRLTVLKKRPGYVKPAEAIVEEILQTVSDDLPA
jgi:hypothetical protein